MSPSQRSTYFATLWPAACKAQGWNPKDAERRRDVTHAATGKASTSGLTEDQITLLFIKLKWLADPTNFDLAMADADPQAALKANKRVQVIYRIEQAARAGGFNEEYLIKAAEHKCAAHRVKAWRELPIKELVNFSRTIHARKRQPAPALQPPAGEPDPF